MTEQRFLTLPPFGNHITTCENILKEFRSFHKIPEDLPLPDRSADIGSALSKIFDMMIYTFGEERRTKIIEECKDFNNILYPHHS